ncbi:dual specificity protein phosphatase PHS1 isoform X2 [Tanacetum coccineum]
MPQRLVSLMYAMECTSRISAPKKGGVGVVRSELLVKSRCNGSIWKLLNGYFDDLRDAIHLQKRKHLAALGSILMLDLVIRNEDCLPCRYLQWHGNSTNLLLAEKMSTANHALEDTFDSAIKRCRPRVIKALQKDRRSTLVNSRMSTDDLNLATKSSDLSNPIESPLSLEKTLKRQVTIDPIITNFDIVAINFGVPRKP